MGSKIIWKAAMLSLLAFVQCSDDGDGLGSFAVEGQFSGSYSLDYASNSLDGSLSITKDGEFSLQTTVGELEGTAIEEEGVYTISIDEGTGAFEYLDQASGTYDTEGQYLDMNGIYENSSVFSTSGSVLTLDELEEIFSEGLEKVSVYFTHEESCTANIYLSNLQEIEGLTGHYAEGALCSSVYDYMDDLKVDVDYRSTKLYCHDVVLRQEDGSYTTYTLCETAFFVLDKESTYSYTVEWSNGEVTSGEFTTGAGGAQRRICISNDGEECEDSIVGKNYSYTTSTVSDIDGNSYKTVIFGEQEWMAENLKTTKLNDGTDIFYAATDSDWKSGGCSGCLFTEDPVYGWYDNSSSNQEAYGALYNGYTIAQGNVCPTDWRVPTDDDWMVLELALGMPEDELDGWSYAERGSYHDIAQQLREAGFEHWEVSDFDAEGDEGTDNIEFGARPGGTRDSFGGSSDLGEDAVFWTSTLGTGSYDDNYYVRRIQYYNSGVSRHPLYGDKGYGYSIRCMRDAQ